jgi:hypothetical protein
MSRKTKSARGEMVDFDLLQVKSKIQEADKPLDVKTREDFVHLKRKRRGSSKISEMIKKQSEKLEQEKEKEMEEKREQARKHLEKQKANEETSDSTSEEETTKKEKTATKRKIIKKD